MEKFDLMNTRFDPTVRSHLIYDSSEDAKLVSYTPKLSKLSEVSFKSTQPRISSPLPGEGTNTLDFTTIDRFGSFHEVSKKIGEKNLLKFSTTTEHTKHPPRKRINTPIMNAVLDNVHDVQPETIAKRLEKKKIKGGIISLTKKEDLLIIPTRLGPGEYDLPTNPSSTANLLKFSSVPRECDIGVENRSPRISKRNKYFKGYLQSDENSVGSVGSLGSLGSVELNAPAKKSLQSSQSQHQLHRGNKLHSSSGGAAAAPLTPPATATIKFSKCDRWKDHRVRTEAYVKTTGLILAPNWDKKLDKKIYLDMTNGSMRGDGLDGLNGLTASVDLDVNCGSKMTLQRSVELSPLKYSAVFKSSAKVGLEIPPSTSGPLGPGSFPGANKSTLEIRWPDKPTCSMMTGRKVVVKMAVPDSCGELKPSPALVGGKFNVAGKEAGANIHIRNFARKKIGKIYPRLAVKKYGAVYRSHDSTITNVDKTSRPHTTTGASSLHSSVCSDNNFSNSNGNSSYNIR